MTVINKSIKKEYDCSAYCFWKCLGMNKQIYSEIRDFNWCTNWVEMDIYFFIL